MLILTGKIPEITGEQEPWWWGSLPLCADGLSGLPSHVHSQCSIWCLCCCAAWRSFAGITSMCIFLHEFDIYLHLWVWHLSSLSFKSKLKTRLFSSAYWSVVLPTFHQYCMYLLCVCVCTRVCVCVCVCVRMHVYVCDEMSVSFISL